MTLSDGRGLDADDAGEYVAVLDATYAATADLAVGDTIDVGGTDMEIVGIVASTSSEADTAANVYIPLDVAQALAGVGDVVSTVYVQADSADAIAAVQAAIQEALPDATVSSQSDLASTVSGSLVERVGAHHEPRHLALAHRARRRASCSRCCSRSRASRGAPASSARSRRSAGRTAASSARSRASPSCRASRRRRRASSSGLVGIWVINLVSPTISTAPVRRDGRRPRRRRVTDGGPGGGGPGFGGLLQQTGATDIVLHAPLTLWVIVAAVGLAVARRPRSPARSAAGAPPG